MRATYASCAGLRVCDKGGMFTAAAAADNVGTARVFAKRVCVCVFTCVAVRCDGVERTDGRDSGCGGSVKRGAGDRAITLLSQPQSRACSP